MPVSAGRQAGQLHLPAQCRAPDPPPAPRCGAVDLAQSASGEYRKYDDAVIAGGATSGEPSPQQFIDSLNIISHWRLHSDD